MKKNHLLLSLLLLGVSVINAQNSDAVYETVENTPSTITINQNIIKTDVQYRMSKGMASILVDFEGDLWDIDSKAAVRYACSLLEEYLRTTYPIRIKAVRSSSKNVPFANTMVRLYDNVGGKYGAVPLTVSSWKPDYKIPTAMLKRIAISHAGAEFFKTAELFEGADDKSYDGVITFSKNDIFSHTIDGNVEADKYDMVTVTLREMAKVIGMFPRIRRTGSSQLEAMENNCITPFLYRVTYATKWNPTHLYTAATTQGKLELCHGHYNLYTPSVFNQQQSLMYFAPDANNIETLLLQPELPKGTSITNIGNALGEVLDWMGWITMNDIVGIGGGDHKNYAEGKPDKNVKDGLVPIVINLEGKTMSSKSTEQATSPKTIPVIRNTNSSFPYAHFQDDGLARNSDWSNDNILINRGDKRVWYGFYLARKDGKLEDLTDLCLKRNSSGGGATIDLAQISDIDNYARTSDGFLRARLNYNVGAYEYESNYARYMYINYTPAVPSLAVKTKFTKAAPNNPSATSKEIELTFDNVQGVKRVDIIQKKYIGKRATTVYHVLSSPQQLSEIFTIDKDYKYTFQLLSENNLGSQYSNIIEIQPETVSSSYALAINNNSSNIELNFTDQDNLPADIKITNAKIVGVNNPFVSKNVSVNNNQVDISSLPSGVYAISTTDENNNIYTKKFVK